MEGLQKLEAEMEGFGGSACGRAKCVSHPRPLKDSPSPKVEGSDSLAATLTKSPRAMAAWVE